MVSDNDIIYRTAKNILRFKSLLSHFRDWLSVPYTTDLQRAENRYNVTTQLNTINLDISVADEKPFTRPIVILANGFIC